MTGLLSEAKAMADRLLARKLNAIKASEQQKVVPGDVVLTYLFDAQRALADDPHQFVTACTGRRGGKTTAAAALLLRAAKDNPKRAVLYLTLTKDTAKLIIWDALKDLNTLFGLGGEPSESDLTMRMPNGALIILAGVDKRKEIEKRRGQGFALVVIDECQSIPEYVRDLVDAVIAPALMDVPGRLLMIGTPSLLESGYWFECHHNKGEVWGHHTWTSFDNPTLPNPRASLDAECKRRGVTEDDPTIQREWFARWVRDLLSAIFKFDPKKNVFNALPLDLPAELWRYIIAFDIGGGVEKDNDAISVLAYHPHARATWLVEEHVEPKQDVSALAEKVKGIRDRLGAHKVSAIVADAGALGAKVVLELNNRHHLAVIAAKKADKFANIELLNAACVNGEFYAKAGGQFASEAPKVQRDWDKSTPTKIEIKGHMPDICDSTLYGYVESLSWLSKPVEEPPAPGSPAWAEQQRKAMFERAQRDVQRGKAQTAIDDWGAMGAGDEWGIE